MVFLLFWMERHHIQQHIHVTVPLHRKSFPNFMNGWTLSRWTRRRFVQIWPSIILMICRLSIECTMKRDFQQDRTLLGQIELRWVYDCSRSFTRHSWIRPPKIWIRPLLAQITPAQLRCKAATVRNTQVTLSGKTPLELAIWRRPRDLMDRASMDPEQLTSTSTKQDLFNE